MSQEEGMCLLVLCTYNGVFTVLSRVRQTCKFVLRRRGNTDTMLIWEQRWQKRAVMP